MAKTREASGPRPVAPVAKQAPQGASRTGETVTVACKLPNGLIIRGFTRDTRTENVLGGGRRDEAFYREDGRRVTIYGNARPKGGSFRTRVVCGYAMTQGVPKDLFDEWLEANADLPAVRNRLVFAFPNTDEAVAAAKEGRDIRSGLEPMMAKIEDDPRTPRPMDPQIGDITIDTEKMKRDAFEDDVEDA